MVRAQFPQVELINSVGEHGFSANHNRALRRAAGRHLLILNPDTVVRCGALDHMVGFLEDNQEAGAVGARQLRPDGRVDLACARHFPTPMTYVYEQLFLQDLFPGSRVFGRYYLSYWDHDELREVDLVSGACMMVRRETAEQVGLLDSGYFLYYEDTDWCYRIKQAGWKIYFLPQAEVIHYGGHITERVKARAKIEEYKSMRRYFKKHHQLGAVGLALLGAVTVISWVVRMSVFTLLALPHTPVPKGLGRSKRRAAEIARDYRQALRWHLCGRRRARTGASTVPLDTELGCDDRFEI
jgi:hypothetical protein